MYGITETASEANAAHVKYKPVPTDTEMPSGTEDPCKVTCMVLTASAFLIMTVHRAAPTRSRILPRIARLDERRNVTVCLATPLNIYGQCRRSFL